MHPIPFGRGVFLEVLPLVLSTGLHAQSLEWTTEQQAGGAGAGFQRPRIGLNGQGDPVVLWGRTSPGAMFTSVFNGGSFSPPVMIHPPDVEAWSLYWAGGDLAADGNELAAVFSTGSLGVGAIYCVTSNDGGSTWGDTVRIAPVPPLEARFPTVAMVPGQGPAVQYMEFDGGWANARYVSARSLDGGSTFQAPVPVSEPYAPGDVCDCCTGQNVADADHLVALFRNNDANIRTIWGVASSDDGASFTVGGELDDQNWNINACPSSGPDGYLTADSIRYVWMSGEVNGTKVHAAGAALSDLSATASVPVHPDQPAALQQNFPRIAGSGDTLGIVWQQSSTGQHEILFSWSVTGLADLSIPDTVNSSLTGMQKNPDVAFRDGSFHIVWEDHASDAVMYRGATITDDTGMDAIDRHGRLRAWPSPASDVLHVQGPEEGVLEILDLAGRTVAGGVRSATWDVSAFAPGAYWIVSRHPSGRVLGNTSFIIAR